MSLVLKYDKSFYEVLQQFIVQLINAMPSVLKIITFTGGVIVVTAYVLYRTYAHRYRRITLEITDELKGLQEIQNYNRSIIRQTSIISHKEMILKLEYSADKCYDKVHALKCIDIVVYCPQLLNVKSSINGITPFHRICFNGHTCLITFMLGKGADPSITTIAGENALCMAVYYFLNNPLEDDFSCLEILHKTGCRFGDKNVWYTSLLRMAVTENNTKLIQWLILHEKAQLHKISRSSSTPPQ